LNTLFVSPFSYFITFYSFFKTRSNKQTLKAQLLTKLEQELDDALARLDDDTPLNLDEIEEIALKARAKMGQALTQALAETQTATPLDNPGCPACQQTMRYKGHKSKVIRTVSGDITLARPYYYCPECRKGLFPPGSGVVCGGQPEQSAQPAQRVPGRPDAF
jgi:hypothetical protein